MHQKCSTPTQEVKCRQHTASFTGIKFTKQELVSESVSELLTNITNDRTHTASSFTGIKFTKRELGS